MEKIEQLKEITGNPDVGFTEADLEGDFDPTKYDKLMKVILNVRIVQPSANYHL